MRSPLWLCDQRGDSIVEVLIAVAIISLVLVGGYNVSRYSSRGVRTSQESSQLQGLIQGQVELVRQMAQETTDPASDIFAASPKYFCIDARHESGTYGQLIKFRPEVTSLPSSNRFDPAVYPDACKQIDDYYALAVTYNQTTHVFEFTGQWEMLSGSLGQEKVFYRLFPKGVPIAVVTPPSPGDPPAPGDDATADIGTKVCTKDPVTKDCVDTGPKTGPIVYHWSTSFENLSDNPGLKVTGCEWDFGDGSPPMINMNCGYGDHAGHAYTPPADAPPAPELCKNKYPDKVITLTMYFEGGKTAETTATKHIPVCYADF